MFCIFLFTDLVCQKHVFYRVARRFIRGCFFHLYHFRTFFLCNTLLCAFGLGGSCSHAATQDAPVDCAAGQLCGRSHVHSGRGQVWRCAAGRRVRGCRIRPRLRPVSGTRNRARRRLWGKRCPPLLCLPEEFKKLNCKQFKLAIVINILYMLHLTMVLIVQSVRRRKHLAGSFDLFQEALFGQFFILF